MATSDSIKMDDDGWYLRSNGDVLEVRHYPSEGGVEAYGQFRSVEEAARGYVDAKYGQYVKGQQDYQLGSAMGYRKSIIDGLQGTGPIRIKKVTVSNGGS